LPSKISAEKQEKNEGMRKSMENEKEIIIGLVFRTTEEKWRTEGEKTLLDAGIKIVYVKKAPLGVKLEIVEQKREEVRKNFDYHN
jgi:hypothetical protein